MKLPGRARLPHDEVEASVWTLHLNCTYIYILSKKRNLLLVLFYICLKKFTRFTEVTRKQEIGGSKVKIIRQKGQRSGISF